MKVPEWQEAARRFFDERADVVGRVPTADELCYVSGRDPRLWADTPAYGEMVESILSLLAVGERDRVLEVGCAAGFLARGIAPRVGRYVGLDIAPGPVRVARRLALENAEFRVGDGAGIAIEDGSFDAVFSYDVFTNLPDFTSAAALVKEMVRVACPGGRILIGSVPDADQEQEYVAEVQRVQADLAARRGPLPSLGPSTYPARIRGWLRPRRVVEGAITCYYFRRGDFVRLGESQGVRTEIHPVHPKNVYAPYRFNVLLTRSAQ